MNTDIRNDDDIDARLHSAATHWRAVGRIGPAMPRVAELAPNEVAGRPTRRVLPVLAAAATVAALATGGVLLTHAGKGAPTGAPSTDRVVSPGGVPATDTGDPNDGSTDSDTPPTGAITCRFSEFATVGTATTDAVRQGVLVRAILRYTGSEPCVASGAAATAEVLSGSGSVVASGRDPDDNHDYQTAVRPGDILRLSAIWSSSCGPRPNRVALTPTQLSGAGRFSWLIGADDPVPACSDGATRIVGAGYGLLEPGDPGTLTDRITTPTSVAAGSDIPVSIRLSNTTAATVRLSPCPTFFMSVKPLSTPGKEMSDGRPMQRFRLNCDIAPGELAPGESMDLEQSLSTDGLAPGRYLVSWDWGDGIANAKVVTIV